MKVLIFSKPSKFSAKLLYPIMAVETMVTSATD